MKKKENDSPRSGHSINTRWAIILMALLLFAPFLAYFLHRIGSTAIEFVSFKEWFPIWGYYGSVITGFITLFVLSKTIEMNRMDRQQSLEENRQNRELQLSIFRQQQHQAWFESFTSIIIDMNKCLSAFDDRLLMYICDGPARFKTVDIIVDLEETMSSLANSRDMFYIYLNLKTGADDSLNHLRQEVADLVKESEWRMTDVYLCYTLHEDFKDKTFDEFVQEAKETGNFLFDYSSTIEQCVKEEVNFRRGFYLLMSTIRSGFEVAKLFEKQKELLQREYNVFNDN